MKENVNPAKAYMDGMSLAAYGVSFIEDNASEWQIEAVKEYASKLKEAEIDHMAISPDEKEDMKHQWKLWLDATTDGFKDELKRVGRLD